LQRGVDAECIQGLTHLTALQELRLQASPPTKPQALAPLEHLQALSMLEIHGASSCDFAPDNASFLAALPQLQHVALLQYNSLDARVFSAQLLGQLQHLHLGMRSPIRPAMYVYPGMPFPAADLVTSNGWEPVLAVLADCTALTELRLSHLHDPRSMHPPGMGMLYPQGMELDEADAAARGAVAAAAAAAVAEAAAAFAGLTASTRLQVLHLSDVSLTPGAWAHIFPADHQLPSLRDLTLCNCQQALGSTGFAQLVSCCPGVTALCLDGVLQHNAWVQPLLQLTGLRQLQLLQRVQGDMANLLVQLTGLEGLDTGQCGVHGVQVDGTACMQLYHMHLNRFRGRCVASKGWDLVVACVGPLSAGAAACCCAGIKHSELVWCGTVCSVIAQGRAWPLWHGASSSWIN
jgi:hypothetical protein